MAFFLAAIFVVSIVATLLLAPKAKTEDARASGLDALRSPRASEGAPVPLILGRGLMRGPNTIWVGDFEAVPIIVKQKTGIFSSKKVIVGYNYFVGLDLCLALGPCTLHSIVADKDALWSGTANTDGQVLSIDLPNLYGGPQKGGGFVGTLRYYTGSATQGISAYLESKIGVGDVPAYRGFSHLVLEKVNIGEQNNLRQIYMEMSRYTNALGFIGGKQMVGQDMNPMEALFQAFTLEFGGLDIPLAMLDVANMLAVGNTLFDEGNGITLIISSPNSGKDIADAVLRQCDALMYQDPATGKMIVKLIRNDYDVNDLPVFDESNIVAVRGFTSKSWEDTINQIRVTYTNKDKNYEKGTAMVQDLANISAQGRIRSATQAYPNASNATLAVQIATRSLSRLSVPLMGASLETNREGASLRPGDPFVWAWGPYGLVQTVMRVTSFDLGALNDNRIVLSCTQDEYALGLTVFAAPTSPGSATVPDSTAAAAATVRLAFEAPYFIAGAAGIGLTAQQGIVAVAAVPPSGSVEYDIYTSLDTIAYNSSGANATYTPTGVTTVSIAAATGVTTGTLGSLTLTITSTELVGVTATDVASGAGLFLIGSELFAHEGVTNNMDGTYTLANVRRSLLDTVPAAHASGARVWFLRGDNVVEDVFAWEQALRVKLTPRTFRDVLTVASAPFDSLTLTKRAARPLAPANVKFNAGVAFTLPADGSGSVTVTWANRSRLEGVVRTLVDNNNSFEVGQETIFRYRINGGSWVSATIANGVATHTFNAGAIPADTVDYEIYSQRDGLLSRTKWQGTANGSVMTGA
jgi:hypothetical protein